MLRHTVEEFKTAKAFEIIVKITNAIFKTNRHGGCE